MIIEEINKFVYQYLTKYKTQSAIMLTGEWGSGKSYYIQEKLIPYLAEPEVNSEKTEIEENDEKERIKFQSIVISLYGLTTVDEISRSIYFQACAAFAKDKAENFKSKIAQKCDNSKFFSKRKDKKTKDKQGEKNEILTMGKGICKTLLNKIDLKLNLEQQDYSKLIETINLERKLIILEDIERTNIDILELLGYINSLVEQDGIKVLLVANEESFIRIDKDAAVEKKEWVKSYLQKKEKTISDTLYFEADTTQTIESILDLFLPVLSGYKDSQCIYEIREIFKEQKTKNYRSFIFACQKTVDIFEKIQPGNQEFADCIFYSIIAFCLKYKKGDNYNWLDRRKESSFDLGTKKYPLFRFCYNYILYHKFDAGKAVLSEKIFKDLCLINSSKSVNDPDIKILYDYSNYSDDEVKKAIQSVREKLKQKDSISFSEYCSLALNLLKISRIKGMDFSMENYKEIEAIMVENLHGKGEVISPDLLSRNRVDPDESCANDYRASMSKMIDSLLQKDHDSIFGFKYTVDTVQSFYDNVSRDAQSIIRAGGLMSKLNIEDLIGVLKKCSSREMNLMRDIFDIIYMNYGVPEEDMEKLKLFRDKLKELEEGIYTDAILKDNFMRFVSKINDCCNRGIVHYS